jgi:hypothetical protein
LIGKHQQSDKLLRSNLLGRSKRKIQHRSCNFHHFDKVTKHTRSHQSGTEDPCTLAHTCSGGSGWSPSTFLRSGIDMLSRMCCTACTAQPHATREHPRGTRQQAGSPRLAFLLVVNVCTQAQANASVVVLGSRHRGHKVWVRRGPDDTRTQQGDERCQTASLVQCAAAAWPPHEQVVLSASETLLSGVCVPPPCPQDTAICHATVTTLPAQQKKYELMCFVTQRWSVVSDDKIREPVPTVKRLVRRAEISASVTLEEHTSWCWCCTRCCGRHEDDGCRANIDDARCSDSCVERQPAGRRCSLSIVLADNQ